jgi:hypothetical protein
MWEVRKLYVSRFRRGSIIFIGESEERAATYCPTGIEGDGVIEEWMCAVRNGEKGVEIEALARVDPEDYGMTSSAVVEVAPVGSIL